MKMSTKVTGFAALFVSLSLCVPIAQARNDAFFLPIQDAIKADEAKPRLNNDIKLYFGDQPYPAVEVTLFHGFVAYKKGSIFEKTEVEACNLTFLAALVQIQERARRMGGNAVINIESFYKKRSFRSNDKYECHAGSAKTGVMLRGDIVKLRK